MGLRDRLRKLAAPSPAPREGHPGARHAGMAATTIADAPLRTRTTVAGEISDVRVVPRAGSPSLEVDVDDGTGIAVGVFTGRRAITGIHPGRGVVLEGVARRERNRLVLLNPAYRLL